MSDSKSSILYITQYFPPETGAGSTRAHELSKRWAKKGCDITVLTSAPDYPEGEIYSGYENRWMYKETVDDITVIQIKTITASNKSFARRSLKFIWFMILSTVIGLRITSPDVIISTSPQPLTGVTGLVLSYIHSSKFIFEVRDLWPESIVSLSSANYLIVLPLTFIVNQLYSHSDRIVVVSNGIKENLIERGINQEDIWFHPNGTEISFFNHDGESWQIESSLQEEFHSAYTVSYIGTVGRAHGLSVILDAASRLQEYSNIQFVVVGYGAEADKLQSQAEQRGLTNVQFVGKRPKEQIPDFLALSDISLVHLRNAQIFQSAIPMKLIEAMASGTPVLLGIHGEAMRIVQESETGLTFTPEDGEEMAEKILYLKEESNENKMGKKGRSYVRKNFSWDVIADEYIRNIQNSVSHKSG